MIDSVLGMDHESTVVDADGTLNHDALNVAVYGVGPTGLALAVLCSRFTPAVTAADTDSSRITAIKRGHSPVSDPLLSEYLTAATDEGTLRATAELPAAAAEATIHLVAVPTGIREDDAPDLSTLRATVRDIGTEISPGDIVIIATSVPPGTTEGVVATTLVDESGLDADAIGLGVCALPTDRSMRAIRSGDLVVAGSDSRSQTATKQLFSAITTGTVSTTPRLTTAECVESVERSAAEMLRCLSNELAISAPEINVPTVAELVSMRGGFDIPSPGVDGNEAIGAGFLRDALVDQTPVLDSVYSATTKFPRLIAETVLSTLDEQSTADPGNPDDPDDLDDPDNPDGPDTETTILILGVPTDNSRPTADRMPVSLLIRELTRAETRPLICDPVAELPRSLTPHSISVTAATQLDPDAVVVLSFRLIFENIDWSVFDESVVIDCCGSDLDGVGTDIHRLGGSALRKTR